MGGRDRFSSREIISVRRPHVDHREDLKLTERAVGSRLEGRKELSNIQVFLISSASGPQGAGV